MVEAVSESGEPVLITDDWIKPAASVLTRAFQGEALFRSLIHDEAERHNVLRHFFEFRIRFGYFFGEVYTTSPKLEGVAAWIRSENTRMTRFRILRSGGLALFMRIGRENIDKLRALGDYVDDMHKRCAPFRHWYLGPIGVDPELQGRGWATVLMNPMLDRIEREGLPCFLETQSEKNVGLYEHFGFKVVEVGSVPGTDVGQWAMLRAGG